MKIRIMNHDEFNRLLEIAMRRPLSAAEEARLQACLMEEPAAKAIWEEEQALSRLLGRLPDAPLASNFTARVLQALERDSPRQRRTPPLFRWFGLHRPARQAAALCLVLVLIALGYSRYQSVRRERMALALARVAPGIDTASEAVALAPDELWKDFDAINRLPQTKPQADEELLALLKEVAMK